MPKDFDELIRDIDLIIENVDSLKMAAPRGKNTQLENAHPHAYDSFCEIFALKAVLKAFISSVDTIVKVQIANKVEQDIDEQLEHTVRKVSGGSVDPDDLAQITAYVRHTASELLE
ncbi:hypothetical protein [Edaphovirga cremea]|uniref:hypothetical protein n=1 Tax=Edaphovirga cremea TaxID=2267246 RepID=UPI000DEFD4F0|nr:hypothetical protein [Edaphovirga cremea]